MKIAIITDTHFGEKNGSPRFYQFYKKFLEEQFFKEIDKQNVDMILHGGDLFHNRMTIDIRVWQWTQENFLDPIEKRGIPVVGIVGNHDVYYKSTSEVNSPQELLKAYPHFRFIKDPETMTIGSKTITLLPWIHSRNQDEMLDFIQQNDTDLLLGHLELAGFKLNPGMYAEHGVPVEHLLQKFERVWSGHYHTQSQKGNIKYLGAPIEFNWNDFNDPKGFHIYDTETDNLKFYQNKNKIYHKIYVKNDTSVDEKKYKDKIARLIISEKQTKKRIDDIVQRLNQYCWEVKVIDYTQDVETLEKTDDESKSTLDIIKETVDEIDVPVDKQKLTKYLQTLYTEAEAMR